MAVILHVDMDAFFASVEIRDDPSLRGKPVLVGGVGRRGVVAAASYEARVFGCRSAMPMAVALRKCPHAIVLPSRFDAYVEASDRAFAVFDRFSPVVEPLSIDEAFLDLSGTERLLGSPVHAGESLRRAVAEATGGLTCSVGIANVKFIAKMASESCKPDGLAEVPGGGELEFLHSKPIGKLWGVGPKKQATLAERGIKTIGDLAGLSSALLEEWFGEHGLHLHRLSHGVDPRTVDSGRGRKSVSHEDTFAIDLATVDELRGQLLSQATRVADRLVAAGEAGRQISVKLRDITFKTETRQCTLPRPTSQAKVIYDVACRLLDEFDLRGRRFRLTGVAVADLRSGPRQRQQLDLFAQIAAAEEPPPRGEQLQSVLSAIRQRYGHQALYPANAGDRERPNATGAMSKHKTS